MYTVLYLNAILAINIDHCIWIPVCPKVKLIVTLDLLWDKYENIMMPGKMGVDMKCEYICA